jgi:hypothetical protein
MVFKGLSQCARWTSADAEHVLPYCLPRRSFSNCMTRFSDPNVVEHDFGAYSVQVAHGLWLRIPESITNPLLNSGAQVLLAYNKWPLHVGVIRRVDSRESRP